MNSDITRIDSKGRILIPAKIRKSFGVNTNDKVMIVPDGEGIKIMPITRNNNRRVVFTLTNFIDGIDDVNRILSSHDIDIIASWSRKLSGNLVEWDTILHTNGSSNKIDDIKKKVKMLGTVRDMIVKSI